MFRPGRGPKLERNAGARDAANFKPTNEPSANEKKNIQMHRIYLTLYYITLQIITVFQLQFQHHHLGWTITAVSVFSSYVRLSNALATKRRTACLSPSNILCQAVSAAASSSFPFWISACKQCSLWMLQGSSLCAPSSSLQLPRLPLQMQTSKVRKREPHEIQLCPPLVHATLFPLTDM